MTFVDHLFIFILFVVQPVYGAISQKRYMDRIKAGKPSERLSAFRWTIITQWLALAVFVTFWFMVGRPFSDLGFVRAGGTGFYVGIAVLLAGCGFLLYTWRRSKTMTNEDKSREIDSLGDLVHLLPRTRQDLHAFFKVSLTAGIVEEILYRGFVIWYLGLVMPLWAAVVMSSVFFGLGHSYQGISGALKTGLIGLSFGALYILTGSIWLPILGHILLDALTGLSILEILGEKEPSVLQSEEVGSEPGATV